MDDIEITPEMQEELDAMGPGDIIEDQGEDDA